MEATKKICVRCKQKDITEFSTCRFCGTRYDAVLPQARPQSSFDLGSILRSRLGPLSMFSVFRKLAAVLLMMGIGMLITAVMDPHVSEAIAPIIKAVVPVHALPFVIVFALICPLALYRGPLSLWGMGSGLVSLVLKVTTLSAASIMAMLMSVGQIQGVCDPTNTQNIWIANYLQVDTQAILRKTIPFAWLAVIAGLLLAVAKGFVPW